MTETRNITINGYGGSSLTGHVSITLGSTTYEQQWDQSSYDGLFTSTAGPNDGLIRSRPNPGEPDPLNDNRPTIGPSVSIVYAVPTANYQAALDYIRANIGINNYGLFTQNCVTFVDNVASAAGLSTYEWRYEMARQGVIPGAYPIEAIISLPRPDLSIWEAEGLPAPPLCFPATAPIAVSPTETCPISDIRVGDTVLAFDPAADLGRGALVPRKVVRLYRNTTEEWVKLTWAEGGEAKELIATPGHHFLDRFGSFPTIEEMLENGKVTVVKNWLKGLLGVSAVCVLAACSILEEKVLFSSTGNCQSSAIESAIHGNWRRQTLSMLELSRGPSNDRTYAELIEARQMQALVSDFSNSLERDRASCRSEASIQFVPQDDRFASSTRRIAFSVDEDGRACVRSIDASNNQYCEQ
jgi:hypothetical protein